MDKVKMDKALCPYHPNAYIISDYQAGDICGDCGLVIVERCIDVQSEWKSFGQLHEADKTRLESNNSSMDEIFPSLGTREIEYTGRRR